MDKDIKKQDAKPVDVRKGLTDKLNEYKGEFKRIVWPTKAELKKNTITVIITCILFGVLIFCMDFVFNTGMDLFAKLVS